MLLVEFLLFITLIYILVNISKHELGIDANKTQTIKKLDKNRHFLKSIMDGITGNIAFYLFVILGFTILKFFGFFESFINDLLGIFK